MAAGPAGLHTRPAGAEVNRSGAAARLTGAAGMWLESVPTDIGFDETIRRFRKRFVDTGRRDELLTAFWQRRQGPDEPLSTCIEEMAGLARRMRLDNEPLMRHGIIQGLRSQIRPDVKIQKPAAAPACTVVAPPSTPSTRPEPVLRPPRRRPRLRPRRCIRPAASRRPRCRPPTETDRTPSMSSFPLDYPAHPEIH